MEKLKVGDTVQVISGAERSSATKRGKIMSIHRDANRLTVDGLRIQTRHVRKGRDPKNQDGGRIEKAGSIAVASVALVCPKCDKPTRVGIRTGEKRSRFCKKCDAAID